jgi:hypothetical protein
MADRNDAELVDQSESCVVISAARLSKFRGL